MNVSAVSLIASELTVIKIAADRPRLLRSRVPRFVATRVCFPGGCVEIRRARVQVSLLVESTTRVDDSRDSVAFVHRVLIVNELLAVDCSLDNYITARSLKEVKFLPGIEVFNGIVCSSREVPRVRGHVFRFIGPIYRRTSTID